MYAHGSGTLYAHGTVLAHRDPPPPPPSELTAPPLAASTATGCNPQNPAFTLEQMGGLLPVTTGMQVAPRFTAVPEPCAPTGFHLEFRV